MDNGEFLESVIKLHSEETLDHDIYACGDCYYRYLMGAIASELLAKGSDDPVRDWATELSVRWSKSHYKGLIRGLREQGYDRDFMKDYMGLDP